MAHSLTRRHLPATVSALAALSTSTASAGNTLGILALGLIPKAISVADAVRKVSA